MLYFPEGWTAQILTLSVGVLGILVFYVKYIQSYWKRRGVHYIQPYFLIGNIKDGILQKMNISENIQSLYQQLKGHRYGGVYLLTTPLLLVRDPELIKHIFIKDFNHFVDHQGEFDEILDPLQAKNLLNMKGEKWKRLRIKMTPTFTTGKMKKMFGFIVEHSQEMKDYLQEAARRQEILELKDFLSKYTIDVIASCAFGIKANSFKNPNGEFRLHAKKILEPSGTIREIETLLVFLSPKLAKLLRLSFVPPDVTKFFRSTVKEMMNYRETNNVTRHDFIDLLIQLKKKGHLDYDDEQSPGLDSTLELIKTEIGKLIFYKLLSFNWKFSFNLKCS